MIQGEYDQRDAHMSARKNFLSPSFDFLLVALRRHKEGFLLPMKYVCANEVVCANKQQQNCVAGYNPVKQNIFFLRILFFCDSAYAC